MRVLISTGGTAGHLYPAISLAEELSEDPGNECLFVGSEGGLEAQLIPAAGFRLETLKVKGFPRKISFDGISAGWQMAKSIVDAGKIIKRFTPDVAVGMGGFASVPAIFRSTRRGIPVVIHEQNLVPGRANRLLAKVARVIAVTFPESERYFSDKEKVVRVGNPIRRKIQRIDREEAARVLGVKAFRPTVVIFGGSRGAKKINEAVGEIVSACMNDYQIIHITGESGFRHFKDVEEPSYKVFKYFDEMQVALSVADLVVSRAGASTISEISVLGIPAIFVPYPYATDDHQLINAKSLETRGAAVTLLDRELNGEKLNENIDSILYNHMRLKAMAESMRSFCCADAAKRMAELVIEVARGKI